MVRSGPAESAEGAERARATTVAPLLRALALTRRFGGLTAVNAVSLELRLGEVHAVIGTNGAGKSTLINMLSGEMPASGGTIQLGTQDITHWSQPRRAQAGVAQRVGGRGHAGFATLRGLPHRPGAR